MVEIFEFASIERRASTLNPVWAIELRNWMKSKQYISFVCIIIFLLFHDYLLQLLNNEQSLNANELRFWYVFEPKSKPKKKLHLKLTKQKNVFWKLRRSSKLIKKGQSLCDFHLLLRRQGWNDYSRNVQVIQVPPTEQKWVQVIKSPFSWWWLLSKVFSRPFSKIFLRSNGKEVLVWDQIPLKWPSSIKNDQSPDPDPCPQ